MKNSRKALSILLVICMLLFPSAGIMPVGASDPDLHPAAADSGFDHVSKERITLASGADACAVLRYVDRAEFDAEDFVCRVPDQEMLNTYVFQKSDGTRTVYFLDENVKFLDGQGNVVEKDLTLVTGRQGYRVARNDIDLMIPANPYDGVSLGNFGHTVSVTPISENAASGETSGNSVVYGGIFGAGADLKYTPLLSGVKEDIILSSYTANAVYSFTVRTDGLNLYRSEKGWYLGKSADAVMFSLGSAVVYDAVGKPGEGTMTAETVKAGEEYIITLSASDAFLSDPMTVYPVTIDPSITVSDNTHGDGAIEDAPIFSGYPGSNFGAYLYDRVGTPNSTYGVGRTVIRLRGLINSSEYKTVSASKIKSVTFYTRDSSGGASQYINLYPLTSNTTWTESGVTWNNVGSYTTSVNYGNTMTGGQWTAFDITALVKAWKNGTQSANAGFIMMNQNESNDKCFDSSECTTSARRPYVVMTYEVGVTLSETSISVAEGGTKTLTATTQPSGQTVTWLTSNSTIATVSSSGVVTAKKAGTATVTAKITDSSGTVQTATCKVYVKVADGVYRIQNRLSGYCLQVQGGCIKNLTNVLQYSRCQDDMTDLYKICQMWKVKYLANGVYSIRPMHKLDMALDVTSNNADVYNIGTTDTLTGVPDCTKWTIEWSSAGYVFKKGGASAYTLQVENASEELNANVAASAYGSSSGCKWNLEAVTNPPAGVLLYNTETGYPLFTPKKYAAPQEQRTLSDMSMTVAVYSGSTISQWVIWTVEGDLIASVNANTGAVTGKKGGTATLTARRYLNGSYKTAQYTLQVTELPNGTYYLKNKQTERYADIKNQSMSDGTQIHQWEFHGGKSQRWEFRHLGDGYYSVKSDNASSAYYMGVKNDSSALDADIVLRTGSLTSGMKWKVEKLSDGAYKIIPKTGESRDYVLAAGTSVALNGYKLVQGDYIDNDSYRDEWLLYCSYNGSVTLDVTYDQAYMNRYYDYSSRVDGAIKKLQEKYLTEFGIWIEHNSCGSFNSYADTYCSTAYDFSCNHAGTDSCVNSSLFSDGSTDLKPYHHNNILNIMLRIPFPTNDHTVKMALIGHETCAIVGGVHRENPYYGLTFPSIGLMTITNFSSKSGEIKTIIHEFGHLYSAPDHYGGIAESTLDIIARTGDSRFNKSCIYGEDKEEEYVLANFTICEGCKAIISSNAERYNGN